MRYLSIVLLFLSLVCCRNPEQLPAQGPALTTDAAPGSLDLDLLDATESPDGDSDEGLENDGTDTPAEPAPRTVELVVTPGTTLSQILGEAGLDGPHRAKAARLLARHLDARRLAAGTPYRLTYDEAGTLSEMRFETLPRTEVVLTLGDTLHVALEQTKTRLETLKVEGTLTHALHTAITREGHPGRLALMLERIFGSNLDFRRLPQGTRFQILYEAEVIDEVPVAVTRILGARIQQGRKTHQAFLYADGGWNYYNEQGMSLTGSFLPSPVAGYRVSSPFSRRRFHPVLKRNMPHLGTDYAAPYGHKVVAVADGTVLEAQFGTYNGNYVKIRHGRGIDTQYLHLSRIAAGVAAGKPIHKGDVLGYVGHTGLASGTHLCFRFWKNGKQVDPRKHMPHVGGGEPAGPGFFEAAAAIAAQLGPMPGQELNAHRDTSATPGRSM